MRIGSNPDPLCQPRPPLSTGIGFSNGSSSFLPRLWRRPSLGAVIRHRLFLCRSPARLCPPPVVYARPAVVYAPPVVYGQPVVIAPAPVMVTAPRVCWGGGSYYASGVCVRGGYYR